MSRLPPVSELVPHAPPMLALDELTDFAPGRATARLTVRDGLFARDGRVDSVVTLEYMAQAVAAYLGYEALSADEAVRIGMLVACRAMTIARPSLSVGEELVIRVERLAGSGHASLFEAETRDARDELVARVTVTLVHGEKPPD